MSGRFRDLLLPLGVGAQVVERLVTLKNDELKARLRFLGGGSPSPRSLDETRAVSAYRPDPKGVTPSRHGYPRTSTYFPCPTRTTVPSGMIIGQVRGS
jgi:hypothetical protein